MVRNAVSNFRWLDLAASDLDSALEFYCGLFGWEAREHQANGGVLTRLRHRGEDVGSAYQLGRRERSLGVPSHWTPYVRVEDLDRATTAVASLGGTVLVPAFRVEGMARISLVLDTVGATVGLWQEDARGVSARIDGRPS